jgi:hypothetical protein
MPNLFQVIAVATFMWPWANPTWVKLTPTPINLTAEKAILNLNKPLTVDDDYAHVQVDLGKTTPDISHAITYRTFDKGPPKGIHIQLCRTVDDCIELQFKGMSFSREYYDAGYFIPDTVKRGDKFREVRIWSDTPMQGVIVHWVSGDTG